MARYNRSWYSEYLTAPPAQLCCLVAVVVGLAGFSWYINYESMMEDFMDQLKLGLMVFPVLLLLAVHWLSTQERRHVPFFIPLPEQESIHRAGGSPWGVGLLLIFLMFMISYHSSIKESWWPLFSK